MPATVVLFIDGLPAHLPGPYGNTTVETPALNRLAADSTLFDFCFTEFPHLDQSYPLLLKEIAREGSIFLSDCPEALNLAANHPFDSIVDAGGVECQRSAGNVTETQVASFFAQAIEALQTLEDDGLCWLHHRGLCGPWDAPWEIRASFMSEDDPEPPTDVARPVGKFNSASDDPDQLLGYQQCAYAQVVVIDQMLGIFLDHLRQTGKSNETSFVFGATRGYPLGEHGIVGEFDNLYNETLHVPLMIRQRLEDDAPFGSRNHQLFQFADVNRLIGELLNGDELSLHGNDVARSSTGPLKSLQNDQWKLICSAQDRSFEELYAKPDDRWDVNDVSRRCADIVQALRLEVVDAD